MSYCLTDGNDPQYDEEGDLRKWGLDAPFDTAYGNRSIILMPAICKIGTCRGGRVRDHFLSPPVGVVKSVRAQLAILYHLRFVNYTERVGCLDS